MFFRRTFSAGIHGTGGITVAADLVPWPTALEELRANAGVRPERAISHPLGSNRPCWIDHVESGWQGPCLNLCAPLNPEGGAPKGDPDHGPDSSPPA